MGNVNGRAVEAGEFAGYLSTPNGKRKLAATAERLHSLDSFYSQWET